MKKITRYLCVAMLWGMIPGIAIANPGVQALFQAALVMEGSAQERIKAFEGVLKIDKDHAPSHFEIAKLYQSLNTPAYRQYARTALTRALQVDPDNIEYQLALGHLMWAQGLLREAMEQYEKVLMVNPGNAEAIFGIGHHALKNYLKYRDMIATENGVVLEWEEVADKDYQRAVVYLQHCIEVDPDFRDGYYQLGLAYFERNQIENFIQVAAKLLERYPNHADALLFCGLGWPMPICVLAVHCTGFAGRKRIWARRTSNSGSRFIASSRDLQWQ